MPPEIAKKAHKDAKMTESSQIITSSAFTNHQAVQLQKKKYFESLVVDDPCRNQNFSRMLTEESKDEEMSTAPQSV